MGKDDKGGSLKIPDKAIAILKHYEQFKQGIDDFVFPELKGADLNDEFKLNRTIGYKTIGYQANFITQAADDVLDAVINKTNKKP